MKNKNKKGFPKPLPIKVAIEGAGNISKNNMVLDWTQLGISLTDFGKSISLNKVTEVLKSIKIVVEAGNTAYIDIEVYDFDGRENLPSEYGLDKMWMPSTQDAPNSVRAYKFRCPLKSLTFEAYPPYKESQGEFINKGEE